MSGGSSAALAVVTGAASGIGKATVERFVDEGFRAAALDRSIEGLDALKGSRVGPHVHPFRCDLSDVGTLTPLARRIVVDLGPPRVLVNSAGVCLYADITETTDEMWETSLNTNLVGASALIRGFVPGMKRVAGAAIVNVASRNALSSSPRAATYDASKAALLALTRTLAVELGGDGIRVNAVLPGFIDTPIHGDLLEDRVFVRNYLKLIPLNRIGKPRGYRQYHLLSGFGRGRIYHRPGDRGRRRADVGSELRRGVRGAGFIPGSTGDRHIGREGAVASSPVIAQVRVWEVTVPLLQEWAGQRDRPGDCHGGATPRDLTAGRRVNRRGESRRFLLIGD